LYRERHRPQFHFTPAKGWTNDPNGLVYYQGEYHLFFQHNPFGTKWGNMTWGHAVSRDLVRWKQLASAIEPDATGTIFSGSAVVDEENTAGFARGPEKTLVAMYTAAGGTSPESKGKPFTQSLAYSNDRGRTWTKYAGNPVIPHVVKENRDPKVVWHAPTRRWIVALFLDGQTFTFFSSPDLKQWTRLHDITVPGAAECPDFFEMAVEGEPGARRWVWTGANGHYLVGSFDGVRFVPEVMTQPGHEGRNYYAVQTYSGLPGMRRVQVAWMNGGEYPGMPFNQQMSFPVELKLRRAGLGMKLYGLPVAEIAGLYTGAVARSPEEMRGELWDIRTEIEAGTAAEFGFRVFGRKVSYRAKEKRLANGEAGGRIGMEKGRLRLRMLVDRTSVEVYANEGELMLPCCFLPQDGAAPAVFYSEGGAARVVSFEARAVASAWS
jgi:sucrose-6-phosphate hydrolase SacC (GH32 family)